MTKQIKITYLKKVKKFLLKNSNTITELDVNHLMILTIKNKIYNIYVNLDIKEYTNAKLWS